MCDVNAVSFNHEERIKRLPRPDIVRTPLVGPTFQIAGIVPDVMLHEVVFDGHSNAMADIIKPMLQGVADIVFRPGIQDMGGQKGLAKQRSCSKDCCNHLADAKTP